MGKSNRNSKHVIENDIKFIDEILGTIKRQDLQDAKCMLKDWKHELEIFTLHVLNIHVYDWLSDFYVSNRLVKHLSLQT